jgi:hypothetical protein
MPRDPSWSWEDYQKHAEVFQRLLEPFRASEQMMEQIRELGRPMEQIRAAMFPTPRPQVQQVPPEVVPQPVPPTRIEALAEWVFEHRASGLAYKALYKQALVDSELKTEVPAFTTREFTSAYQRVYKTEGHRRPAGGWPLQSEFAARPSSSKSA